MNDWLKGNRIFQTQWDWYTYKLEDTVTSPTTHRFKPDKIQELRKRNGHKVTPLTNKIFASNTCCESRKAFSPRATLCIVNHTPGWAPSPKEVNQYKMDSLFLYAVLLFWLFFVLLRFLFVYFGFYFFIWEGERKSKNLKLGLRS